MVKGQYVVRRVEGGLSVEQQQKTGANGKTLSRQTVRFQLLVERRSPVLFGSGVEGLSECAGNARRRTAEVERVRSSNPLVREAQRTLRQNIPLEETVVSSPKPFSTRHNSPQSPKNGRCFRGNTTKIRHCAVRRFFRKLVLFAARDVETLVEAVNTATGSNITLFASEERVALAAHVEVQVMTNGGADFHYVTARAASSNFFVFRVNIFFSWENLGLRPRRSSSPNARHHAMLKV